MKINRIIVSQSAPGEAGKSPYTELADKYHFQVDFKPFIRIEGVTLKEFRQYKVDILSHGAVFLTGRTAVDHYFRICEEMRVKVPDTMKYFCASESIANYLQKYIVYRKRKIIFGSKIEELLDLMQKHKNEKIFLPLSDPHKPEIPKLLDKKKYNYTKVILYRTVSSDLSSINIKNYDVLAFYSPTEIKSLFQNFPDYEQGEAKIACFGPTTVKAAKAAKLRVDIQAPRSTVPSLTMAIDQHLKNMAKAKEVIGKREEEKGQNEKVKPKSVRIKTESIKVKPKTEVVETKVEGIKPKGKKIEGKSEEVKFKSKGVKTKNEKVKPKNIKVKAKSEVVIDERE